MPKFETPEQEWRAFLMGDHPRAGGRSGFRFIPSGPRCKQCAAPFGPPGGTKVLSITLAPGHYAVVCNLPGHYRMGMHQDFTVV